MKKVLQTIYFNQDEDYPVVSLTSKGNARYKARVPRDVVARYRAATTSYHAARAELSRALDDYEKTLPPPKPGQYFGVSSCA